MGMDQRIVFASAQAPSWPAIAERLAAGGLAGQLRMIDGDLCFPDEVPPETWSELRLGMPHGMITIRRESDGIRLVIWGNADAGLLGDRDQIAAVLAEMTKGTVAS